MKKTIPIAYAILILIAVISTFLWYIKSIKTDQKIIIATEKKQQIEKLIDTIETKRNEIIETISEKSTQTVKKSNQLIKKLQNETPKIPDAHYDSMCKYIENYRPDYR